MIKKFLLILITLCIVNGVLFAADTSTSQTNGSQFVKDDYISTSGELKCRSLKEPNKYQTRIIGYDFINGIIKCEIIPIDKNSLEVPKTENANKKIIEQTFDKYLNKSWLDYVPLVKIATKSKDILVGTKTTEIEIEKGSTLSSYLSGLAVLKNIDAENTAGMSEITSESAGLFTSEEITKSTSNVAAKLNQANVKYFKNLFTNMNTVYIHLQNLLFVVVGGFFLATLGGGKIQKYLENRGQSTGNKEPYLHKFFIPLLCAGVFYMPITSGGGVNSTMIQKVIQYFTMEANYIADAASNIGSQAYVRKRRLILLAKILEDFS